MSSKRELIFALPDRWSLYPVTYFFNKRNCSEVSGPVRGGCAGLEMTQSPIHPELISLKLLTVCYCKFAKLRMIIFKSTVRNRAVTWGRVMEICDQPIFPALILSVCCYIPPEIGKPLPLTANQIYLCVATVSALYFSLRKTCYCCVLGNSLLSPQELTENM